jgi:hypothetical protein
MIKATLNQPYDSSTKEYSEEYALGLSGLTLDEALQLLQLAHELQLAREAKKDENLGL